MFYLTIHKAEKNIAMLGQKILDVRDTSFRRERLKLEASVFDTNRHFMYTSNDSYFVNLIQGTTPIEYIYIYIFSSFLYEHRIWNQISKPVVWRYCLALKRIVYFVPTFGFRIVYRSEAKMALLSRMLRFVVKSSNWIFDGSERSKPPRCSVGFIEPWIREENSFLQFLELSKPDVHSSIKCREKDRTRWIQLWKKLFTISTHYNNIYMFMFSARKISLLFHSLRNAKERYLGIKWTMRASSRITNQANDLFQIELQQV